MENCIKLAVFGKISIAMQLDDGHRIAVRRHNEEVDKNRNILSEIIDCVKFSGAFELAMWGHDERAGNLPHPSDQSIFYRHGKNQARELQC